MLEPALICWHSKSFSMASLKGLLSILFLFHYLLPASSTKEITNSYLATRSIPEVSHVPCTFLVPSKEIEKCYQYVQQEMPLTQKPNTHCVRIYNAFSLHRDSFLKWLYTRGGVRVSWSNQILSGGSLDKEVSPAVCNSVQIESNPQTAGFTSIHNSSLSSSEESCVLIKNQEETSQKASVVLMVGALVICRKKDGGGAYHIVLQTASASAYSEKVAL